MPVVVESPPAADPSPKQPEVQRKSRFPISDWRYGLVEAFPVPDEAQDAKNVKDNIQHLGTLLSSVSFSTPAKPFRFFDLPSEIRNRVYDYVLFSKPSYRRADGTRPGSRLACMLVSKRMHQEAAYILYTTYTFKLFPLQLFDNIPTVQELPRRYRQYVANLQIVVGSSWTNPPRSWKVSKHLARLLKSLTAVQTLRVFVELDPSHPSLERYRISENFYTDFCGDLLGDVLEVMPQMKYVELDGNSSVDANGPLVSRLREEAEDQEKMVRWGKEAGWAHRIRLSSQ